MIPYIQYVAKSTLPCRFFRLAPDFELGENYEINCAYSLDGDTYISVCNSRSVVHHFDITKDWFSKSFKICGDLQSVWEEV